VDARLPVGRRLSQDLLLSLDYHHSLARLSWLAGILWVSVHDSGRSDGAGYVAWPSSMIHGKHLLQTPSPATASATLRSPNHRINQHPISAKVRLKTLATLNCQGYPAQGAGTQPCRPGRSATLRCNSL
jgi:hypothetical protein